MSEPEYLTDPAIAASSQRIKHGFFTRAGGISGGIYRGLNVGYGSDDERSNVLENRRRAESAFGARAGALTPVYQVHGTTVAYADQNWPQSEAPKADASVTDRPGIMLAISTADCAPILFADGEAGVVGAAHAGWKGAFGGVWRETVEAMEKLGARRERIAAAVGPTIQQQSYEVGPEFRDRFLETDAANEAFFISSDRDGHYRFDLPGYLRDRMDGLGLRSLAVMSEDTCADEDRFYSYRRTTLRGEPDYGRQLSSIMLSEE